MSLKAIVTVGVSASGKSTWAKELVVSDESFVHIERDEIRKTMLELRKNIPKDKFQFGYWNWKWEKEVTEEVDWKLKLAMFDKKNIVISDTNLQPKYLSPLVKKLEDAGYEVEIKEFPVSLEEAWKRDINRSVSVGHEILYKQYQQWNEYKGRRKYTPDTRLMSAIIVDVDGTLAHMNGKRGPFEWHNVHLDDVDPVIQEIVRRSEHAVIVVSGRDGSCKDATVAWMNRHGIYPDEFFIREAGDMRSDVIVKEEIFWENIADRYNVLYAIDDRPKVCRLWREIGLKVLQVGDPHVEF